MLLISDLVYFYRNVYLCERPSCDRLSAQYQYSQHLRSKTLSYVSLNNSYLLGDHEGSGLFPFEFCGGRVVGTS